jgi:hypothetical protein
MAVASEIPTATPPLGQPILAKEASETFRRDIRGLCGGSLFAGRVESLERRL